MSNGAQNDYNGTDPEVRKQAMVKFWEMLQKDPDLRARCTDTTRPELARRSAWQALKQAGAFKDDPDGIDSVEVRVYEFDRATADKIVTIVIPENLDPATFNPKNVWRCSWSLWSE